MARKFFGGDKIRCLSKHYSSAVNWEFIEIGEVYTVDPEMDGLRDEQMTLVEANNLSGRRPIYIDGDFESVKKELVDLKEAYDRAMRIL